MTWNFVTIFYFVLFIVPLYSGLVPRMESWFQPEQEGEFLDKDVTAEEIYDNSLLDKRHTDDELDSLKDTNKQDLGFSIKGIVNNKNNQDEPINDDFIGDANIFAKNKDPQESGPPVSKETFNNFEEPLVKNKIDNEAKEVACADVPDLAIGVVEVMQFNGRSDPKDAKAECPFANRDADVNSESKESTCYKRKHENIASDELVEVDGVDSDELDNREKREDAVVDLEIRPVIGESKEEDPAEVQVYKKDPINKARELNTYDKEVHEKINELQSLELEKTDLQRKEVKSALRDSEEVLERAKAFEQKLASKMKGYVPLEQPKKFDEDLKVNEIVRRKREEDEDENKNVKTGNEEGNGELEDDERGEYSNELFDNVVEEKNIGEEKRNVNIDGPPLKSGIPDEMDEEVEEDPEEINLNVANAPVENEEHKSEHVVEPKEDKERKGPKIWDQWGKWSSCSVTCGVGKMTRWRHCVGGGCSQGEKEAQIKTCSNPAC